VPIAPGTRLGPYVVQESIGQGAMGVVYRAYHEQLERTGAVKVLQALSPDEETTARFRREAQAIAHMRHPNVLNVFDFGDYEGVPYMIVEYVEGGSLAGRLRRSDLTPEQALQYLRGIGSALDYAHSLGIVHRDVKPANVLLGSADTPILADFGLAKLLQSSSIKSITGVTTGTPAYMAPEQVTGSEIGPAADRYSLAVMAFEMLAGSLPFDDAGVLEVLYAHVHREPPPPSARNATLTHRVDAIILRGLAKGPDSRWESCDAFVSALEQAMLPVSSVAERTVAFAPPVPAMAPPPSSGTAPRAAVKSPQKPSRRPNRLWIAATLILLLLLGTAAVVVLNRPTLDVSPGTVAVGGHITVTATHVPKGQAGEIQIHSALHRFTFLADGSGNVLKNIDLPLDIEPGDHEVDLCWNGSCHVRQTLRVTGDGVAQVSPGTTPSTSPATSPGTTPGKSPSPKPTSNPSPNPTHGPSPTPTTRPTPRPSLTPTPTLSVSPMTVHILTSRKITVSGTYWPPNSTVSIGFTELSVVSQQIGNQNVGSNGSFSWTGNIPSAALPGTATIKVCAGSAPCMTTSITVAA
jgi:serine/threonine-protein kinase